jgi:hypothetical protein
MPTPAAIAAAAVKRIMFIVRVPPQTFTTLVTSCVVGYAENPPTANATLPACRKKILKILSLYVTRSYCEDCAEANAPIREPT